MIAHLRWNSSNVQPPLFFIYKIYFSTNKKQKHERIWNKTYLRQKNWWKHRCRIWTRNSTETKNLWTGSGIHGPPSPETDWSEPVRDFGPWIPEQDEIDEEYDDDFDDYEDDFEMFEPNKSREEKENKVASKKPSPDAVLDFDYSSLQRAMKREVSEASIKSQEQAAEAR